MVRLVGVFLVAISAVCFGTNAIFARIAYDAGANPITFLSIRFSIASVIIFLIMFSRGLKWPRGRLLLSLIFLGGLGLVGATLSFYTAITMAPVNLVIVIAYMYPALVSLLSVFFLKQPMTIYKMMALFLTLTGIVLAIGLDSGGQLAGIILAITTAVSYSLYLAFGSLSIQKAGPIPSSATIIISAAIVYALIASVAGLELPRLPSGWIAIVASALISTILGLLTLCAGLRRIDAASTSMISTFEVVVAISLAVMVLGESITLPKIIGACMVLSAVFILAQNEYKIAQTQMH
jgi:drug/metabolite transporter (DMT)-like permease